MFVIFSYTLSLFMNKSVIIMMLFFVNKEYLLNKYYFRMTYWLLYFDTLNEITRIFLL